MYRDFIKKALGEAAEIARKNFGSIQKSSVKPEDNNQVLTATDLAIGKHIMRLIQTQFPDHNIIDEEAGVIDHHSPYTWVIDPIDGTANFAQGVATYGIILGLLENNVPIAGGFALPQFDKIFTAAKGKGAFCNDTQIFVTKEEKLKNVLLGLSIDGHQENPGQTRQEAKTLGEIILGIRNLRCSGSVFDLGMVAEGRYGGSLCQTSKIWDNVGQDIVITEAGGRYTDFLGMPMDYADGLTNPSKNYTYCTAAPQLHAQLQVIIRASLQGPSS